MAQHESDAKNQIVAYVAFPTFLTALDHLKNHGVPSKIDGTVFPSLSGGSVSHLLIAMRFLGVIDEHGYPRPELSQLVEDKTRKQSLAQLLPKAYAPILNNLDLAKASPSQLEDALKTSNAHGQTRRKAKVFLIKASQFAGIPISGHLVKRARAIGPRKNGLSKRASNHPAAQETMPPVPSQATAPTAQPPIARYSKTLPLPRAGGTLVLSGDFDPFALHGEERDVFYRLVDLMAEFSAKTPA